MIAEIFLPVGLAFIMFSMGLALTLDDFRLVASRPRAVALGLACKMVLLPLVALGAIAIFRPRPEFAVGLMILAACPGGITANLLTHLAGGATALAVTLTAITSITDNVTVPLVVDWALTHFMGRAAPVDLPIARMTGGLFAVATLPLLVGMAINRWAPRLAGSVRNPARQIATALFALIVVGAFASQWNVMMVHAGEILPPAIAVNLVVMAAAFLSGRGAGLDGRETIALVLETGLQNGALGIFVAATLLGSQAMMVPSIVYALVMNVSAIVFIVAVRRAATVA
ncbi:bile acid:sodium symporter family protein [Magnetospirillum moscoviense]|uniref:Na+-dependent transporter n=1 Tax=Magnetospirillum moscoviense TaxID=1437059 RepID=A0A178MGV2_9PROT|nr:bile acid:sodium symporter family protein [Magnetospirillum moscoviense]OAN47910.1 Na+-dependent transporter [Magnetospirillum moscoviense]